MIIIIIVIVGLSLVSSAIVLYQWWQRLDNCESHAHMRVWLNSSLAIALVNVCLLLVSLTIRVHEIILLVGSALAIVVLGLLLHASGKCVDHHRGLTLLNIAVMGTVLVMSMYAVEVKRTTPLKLVENDLHKK